MSTHFCSNETFLRYNACLYQITFGIYLPFLLFLILFHFTTKNLKKARKSIKFRKTMKMTFLQETKIALGVILAVIPVYFQIIKFIHIQKGFISLYANGIFSRDQHRLYDCK